MATKSAVRQTLRPELTMERIVVEFDKFRRSPPKVRIEGHLETRHPRVGLVSHAVVTTLYLGRLGEAWIHEMRDALAEAAPAEGVAQK